MLLASTCRNTTYTAVKFALYEPRREKSDFLHMRLCFRYIDSTIPLLSKYEISSLWPSCVIVEPGLCGTWSETPKTGFLTTRLILHRRVIVKVAFQDDADFLKTGYQTRPLKSKT